MKISVESQYLVDDFGIESAYKMIHDSGFEAVDWNIDSDLDHKHIIPGIELEGLTVFERPMEEISEHYREEMAVMKKYGLVPTQAHAPFPPYLNGRPEVLDYTIKIYKQMILFCHEAGCPRLIIHGVSKSEKNPDLTKEDCDRMNDRLYTSLIPELRKAGDVTVCLENLFTDLTVLGRGFWAGHCCDPHEAAAYIDFLNEKAGGKYFGLCLDTGHLNLMRRHFSDYIPVLGERIVCFHIHDNMQTGDSHLMPYSGNIHWEEFIEELRKINYRGDLSFETFAHTERKRLPAELTPSFMRTNADIAKYFREEILK